MPSRSTSMLGPPRVALRSEDRSLRVSARAMGNLLGVCLAIFSLVDLLFRPAFVPISINSQDVTRDAPPIVTALHVLVNASVGLPCLLGAYLFDFDLRRSRAVGWLMAALLLVVMAGMVKHELKDVLYAVILTYLLAAGALFAATNYGQEAFEGLMEGQAITGTAVLLGAIAVGEYSWGRLSSHTSPNYWGVVALAALAGNFCVRQPLVRLGVVGVGLAILVLTQSRGSMMATAVAGAVVIAIILARGSPARRFWSALGLMAAAIPLILLAERIADKLFLINDPSRGLGSGGTGRSLAWAEAIGMFEANPWIGVGYRHHEEHITRATSAHNAYLATLAELGALGFAVYLVLVGGALVRALTRAVRTPDNANLAMAAFMTAFMSVGFVETHGLQTATPLSLLMFFVATWSWRPLTEPMPVASPSPRKPSR